MRIRRISITGSNRCACHGSALFTHNESNTGAVTRFISRKGAKVREGREGSLPYCNFDYSIASLGVFAGLCAFARNKMTIKYQSMKIC